MKKIYAFIFAALIGTVLAVPASAQARKTVIGVVTDENNEPLAGVGVVIKGTSSGTVTDLDGYWSLSVTDDATLEFSCLSYKTQEIPVAGKTKIDVRLTTDTTLLEEAVVVGYGTMRKSDLTGSVASVSAKSIEDFKTATVIDALAGQVAGVNIVASDGTPGAGFDVKIRGVGSVNGETAPLYIVDGYEVGDIDWIANQDIQSVEVLKDASASAIYGARAANGVVLVTTKSGAEGRPVVSYNGSASFRAISKKMELLTPYEFVKLQMEVNPTKYSGTYYRAGNDEEGNPYKYQVAEDYIGVAGIDWQDEGFRNTWSQNHEVNLRGGIKGSQYLVSFSHFDENGLLVNTGYRKDNVRAKFSQQISKNLNLDLGVNYTNSKRYGMNNSGGTLVNLLRYRPTGGLNVDDYTLRHSIYDPLAESQNNFDPSNNNPVLQAEGLTNTKKAEQWIANGSISWKIIPDLVLKVSGTYNVNNQRTDIFYGEKTSQAFRNQGVYGQTQMTKTVRWSNSNTLTYTKKIKKHRIQAMLGQETSYNGNEYLLGQSQDFPFDDLGNNNLGLGSTPTLVETGKTDVTRVSVFARAFYNYSDRYMFTATFRADASTVFSQKHKWGFFPSFAAAWNIAKEPWMKNAGWVSNLKLRAGWGTVGNDRIASYLSLDLYTDSKYGLGNRQITVLNPKQIPNTDLKWEGSTTTNIGLDAGFVDNRFNLTVDAFIKDTKDLLLAQNLAHVTGFDSQWQNVGKIRNKGIEITLNTVNFNRRNFFWSTDFNISFIKNTLVSLQDGTDYMMVNTAFNSNYSGYDYVAYVNSAIGDIYGYKFDGIYQSSDFNFTPDGSMILKPGVVDCTEHAGKAVAPGMVKYADIDGDGKITTADRTVIGNGQPDWYGGFTNNFEFYGVDLSFMLQFTYGNDVYNATRMMACESSAERCNQYAEVADRWSATNASNAVPSAEGYVKSELYSRFVEDGSFLRLKNLTIGYTFPKKLTEKAHISKLRLYATGQNLFCLTKYSGYDPEVNMRTSPLMPSFDYGAYPRSRVATMGLEIQF